MCFVFVVLCFEVCEFVVMVVMVMVLVVMMIGL